MVIIFVYLTFFRYYSQPYRDEENYDGSYGYNYRNYRSPVQDSSIKGKIEQKYWRGKQKVIEKLGKDQDEFVIAGDAEVDSRLEVITKVFTDLFVCFYRPRGCHRVNIRSLLRRHFHSQCKQIIFVSV